MINYRKPFSIYSMIRKIYWLILPNPIRKFVTNYIWVFILSNFVNKSKRKKLQKKILEHFCFIYGGNDKINDSINFLRKKKDGLYSLDFLKIWLENKNSEKYFNFSGAKLPDICDDIEKLHCLLHVFQDTFLFLCFLGDNYDKSIVEIFDPLMSEGPYGYSDDEFDVTIKKNDVVVDAGAWIGDFSAYAALKGAYVYGFEPVTENFELLEKTSELNGDKITAIKMGLGNMEGEIKICISKKSSMDGGCWTGGGYLSK